jgi:hypothetical protein
LQAEARSELAELVRIFYFSDLQDLLLITFNESFIFNDSRLDGAGTVKLGFESG